MADPFSAAGRFEERRRDAIQQRALEAIRRRAEQEARAPLPHPKENDRGEQ